MMSSMKLSSELIYPVIKNFIAIFLISMFASSVRAATCGFTNLFFESFSTPVVGTGIATVGEDVPVGKVLYTSRYQGNGRNTSYECTFTIEDARAGFSSPMNTYTKYEVVSTPSGPATRIGGRDVFPTNIPGIGAVITLMTASGNISEYPGLWEHTTPPLSYGTLTQGLGQFSHIGLELIKTGPVPPGTQQVIGAALPTFQITSGSKLPFPTSHIFATISFAGNTTMYTKTCQLATPDIDVDLDQHPVTDFSGPGSVTQWKNFDIVLRDCPPFYGYGDYTYRGFNGTTIDKSTQNEVNIRFVSANGTVDGNPLLAKINQEPNAARGVGIELSQRESSESITLDGSGGISLLNLTKDDNATYIIPLKARYVQTETVIGAGKANSSVVFTITYQ